MALKEELEKQGKWLFRYRGSLPLVLLAMSLMIYLYGKHSNRSVTIWEEDYEFYYQIICVFVSLLGLYIRILVVGYTSKNTSGRRVKTLNADVLNTSGAYSLVRHPLYLGNFFMWFGPVLLTTNGWFIFSFCAVYWIYYERIMFAEEQFLRSQFGNVYEKWSENIPAFIPHFKNYKKPTTPFHWKRVLQKERNGLAALFIVFSVFDILGQWIQHKENYNYVILVSCIVSIIIFIVLKFLEKKTHVLDLEW